ncbi:MAG: acyl-CoA-binding protein [Anaerolineae bacterium]|nr:acyl-CoA-binding protein [Anaerolineae bacterium]MCO5193664.1 acyl-CoA-binding protein [Anaerolineae bacterium]MCO5206536.1 acyl-CoA-binding protein [Anaerolineae bacterium]
MSDLQTQFEQAVATSKTLTKKPSNDVLLQLYSLYKQATSGDVSGKRPGMLDPVGRAKYDAWSKLKGSSAEDAMQQYVNVIDDLKAKE